MSQLYISKQLISVDEAKEKYDLSFVEFHGIVAAIPQCWKLQLRQKEVMNYSVYNRIISQKKSVQASVW